MYDCAIVGAGPSGASAAYHLAKKGRSVIILEKETLPRYKPCGGGVAPIVAEWFDFDFSEAISLKVDTVRYTWKMEDSVELPLLEQNIKPIWMVRREVFDRFLVDKAREQGAQLRSPAKVEGIEWKENHWQLNSSQGLFAAKYTIAADGAKGPMASWLGFTKRKCLIGSAMEVEAPARVLDKNVAHFEFGAVANGYAWNFPKADGYSVGVGIFAGRKKQHLKQILHDYASNLFGINLEQIRHHGHPIFLWNGQQKLHTQNAVLAGEAACVVDPFTAEGIRPSIFSGIQAALAVDRAIAGESDALEKYSELLNFEWGKEMAWAQRLAQLFYRAPGICYQQAVKRPSATRKMMQIFCGQLRYSDAAGSAIKRISGGLLA
ncbi:MAG: geranylgeranyl reductase family protein [Prochloraceae cyanobacterium]|nr:geranylgeranyl reductase family protein [Prochloraceae cyanobacterium]